MIKGGSGVIVNVSGVDGIVGKSHRAHGVVAKAGIHGLTVAISAEFARAGVTAVTIAPGTVDTEKPASRYPDFNRADHAAKADIGRLINVHEVASAICAAIDIPALSGSVIRVDGGGRGR
jgi:NAD(P)-dependent dehydrogenase (short-subunit alcohol dehydrogenase family)